MALTEKRDMLGAMVAQVQEGRCVKEVSGFWGVEGSANGNVGGWV